MQMVEETKWVYPLDGSEGIWRELEREIKLKEEVRLS